MSTAPFTREEMLEFGNNSGMANLPVIVVVGLTGSGKSHFINKLAGRTVVNEGANLASCTQICQPIPVNVGQTRAIIIDTPGFNDSFRSDAEILHEITEKLTKQYLMGAQLKGIIYIHSIAEVRFGNNAVQNLNTLRRMCGDEALSNVMLVTSRWEHVEQYKAAARERELREEFWREMLCKGSKMNRFLGDHHSATALVCQLLESDSCVLNIQRELSEEDKILYQTSAGSWIDSDIEKGTTKQAEQSGFDSVADLRRALGTNDEEACRRHKIDRGSEIAKLRRADEQQMLLRQPVSRNVRMEVRKGRTKHLLKMGKLGLRAFPPILSFIGMFSGSPMPGVLEIIKDWFGSLALELFGSDDGSDSD